MYMSLDRVHFKTNHVHKKPRYALAFSKIIHIINKLNR